MVKFRKILIISALVAISSKLLFANSLGSNNLLFKTSDWFNNNNILNLAPVLSFNGFDNRSVNLLIVNTEYNFLYLPINNILLLNPFFLSELLATNHGGKNTNFDNYLNLSSENKINKKLKVKGFVYSNNLNTNSNLIAYVSKQNYKFLLAMNYDYIKNIVNNSSNKTVLNNYNSLISFEYIPQQDETSLKFTYLSSFANGSRNISNNKDALTYFNNNILKQYSFGNLVTLTYKDNPKNDPMWNYYSSLSFSNQYTNFDQKSNLLGAPQIYYYGFSYKVGNTSNINLLNNTMAVSYGLNFGRNNTKGSTKNSDLIIWPTGKEDNYDIFVNNKLNFLDLNKLYVSTGVYFNYLSYKSKGFDSYTDSYFSPIVEISLKPIKIITIKGSYVYKRRLPYLYEKYITGNYFYNDNFLNFKSNDNLKKEGSNQFTGNVSVDYYLKKPEIKVTAKIDAFYYRISNYISYNFLNNKEVMLNNISSASLSGYKASLRLNNSNFSSNITYNFIKGKDNLNNDYLNNLYPSSLVIESIYNISLLQSSIGIRGSLFKSFNNFNNNYPLNNKKLPGYGLLDVYFEYNAFKDVSIVLGVNNVFNKDFHTPYVVDNFNKQRSYYFNFNIKL